MPCRHSAALANHPDSPTAVVSAVLVEVCLNAVGELELAYRLEGSLGGLRVPEPVPPSPADGLWQHTCLEVFVAAQTGSAYREFNFSPSGQWAAYAFSAYRQRDEAWHATLAPRLAVRRGRQGLELDAVLPPALLPAVLPGEAYRLGISAVVEATDGSKSYWALAHPAPQPDFHQPAAFALQLATSPANT